MRQDWQGTILYLKCNHIDKNLEFGIYMFDYGLARFNSETIRRKNVDISNIFPIFA